MHQNIFSQNLAYFSISHILTAHRYSDLLLYSLEILLVYEFYAQCPAGSLVQNTSVKFGIALTTARQSRLCYLLSLFIGVSAH